MNRKAWTLVCERLSQTGHESIDHMSIVCKEMIPQLIGLGNEAEKTLGLSLSTSIRCQPALKSISVGPARSVLRTVR
jgi:hypothetical protein